MKRSLLLLSFIEGSAVMASELCGARLLAPVFGSSLYVWATVMGVTLGALAGGYFAGGSVGQARQKKVLRLVLIVASIYMILMPVIAKIFLPGLSEMRLIPAVLISTLMLLLPPVLALGAASPLFIALQTEQASKAGKVSGTVYGISTAGGIISTFLCGFFLIPDLGLSLTLVTHGFLLLLATAWVLRGNSLIPILVAVVFSAFSNRLENIAGVIYQEGGINGRIVVAEIVENGALKRRLLVNNIIQTEIDPQSGKNTMNNIRVLDSLIPAVNVHERALVLGFGGGSAAGLLKNKGYSVTAVEFDERIISVAKEFFMPDSRIEVVHDDARRFLNNDTGQYNIVLADVFRAEEQPSHVLTLQSLLRLKKQLSPSGILFINWHGYTTGMDGEGTRVLLNTLASAGYSYKLHFTSLRPDYRNTIVQAIPGTVEAIIAGAVNTDDRPVMEKTNARANRKWRQNYLRYYNASK